MTRDLSVVPLEDADRDGIGSKARTLARLHAFRPTLFRVPAGVVLKPGIPAEEVLRSVTLDSLGGTAFAVRSCGLAEDRSDASLAGRFRTELGVARGNLTEAIERVRASFGADREQGSVIVQEMVASDFSGVLFTRSPVNLGLAACELGEGIGDRLVAGRLEPRPFDYGRWSGRIYPQPPGSLAELLERVFVVGMLIERALGGPQDIEWAWESRGRRLSILQSRAITAFAAAPEKASEQERVARAVIDGRRRARGSVRFHDAPVREVVRAPTRMTRSIIERLYSPAGALGRAFDRLGLPRPRLERPYVTSLFGRLYCDVEVERRLFGPTLDRLIAVRRLRRTIARDRSSQLGRLEREIEAIVTVPDPPPPAEQGNVVSRAREIVALAREFEATVYPVAYTATLLAQIAGEEDAAGGATSRMLRDLSRLHHGGDLEAFLRRWGHRSSNDYELATPRFAECPETARVYAGRFADLPWDVKQEKENFAHLRERAKDAAVRRLQPLRRAVLALSEAAGLGDDVFALDLFDVEALAAGGRAAGEVAALVRQRKIEESAWAEIDLGSDIDLEAVELLQAKNRTASGLRGSMVSARIPFEGRARRVGGAPGGDRPGADEILLTRFLKPELVGLFPSSAGCIADVGGALSHAAIVARELRYPILVLPGSTDTIRDGDRVRVEADGRIEIHRS